MSDKLIKLEDVKELLKTNCFTLGGDSEVISIDVFAFIDKLPTVDAQALSDNALALKIYEKIKDRIPTKIECCFELGYDSDCEPVLWDDLGQDDCPFFDVNGDCVLGCKNKDDCRKFFSQEGQDVKDTEK